MSLPIRYKDKWLWLFIYPLMALGVIHIANDNTWWELLHIPSYYTDLLLAFTLMYTTGYYVRWSIVTLDKKLPWKDHFKQRLLKQFLLSLLLPVVVIMIIEILYLVVGLDMPLRESSMFYLEMPLVTIFLALINLVYYILYLRELVQHPQEKQSLAVTHFVVTTGAKQVSIPLDEIAYFSLEDGYLYLIAFDNRKFVLNESLEAAFQKLDSQLYYKLNRQIIASRKSILAAETTDTRKLEVTLNPPFSESIFVSKANASAFMKWWRNV